MEKDKAVFNGSEFLEKLEQINQNPDIDDIEYPIEVATPTGDNIPSIPCTPPSTNSNIPVSSKTNGLSQNSMRDTFMERATPEDRTVQLKNKMGGLSRFLFEQSTSRIARKEAIAIVKTVSAAHLEVAVTNITLALDFYKKELFVAFMKKSAGLQREVWVVSHEFMDSLFSLIMDCNSATYDTWQKNNEKIEQLRRRGVPDKFIQIEQARMDEILLNLLERTQATMDKLKENHEAILERCLKVFCEKLAAEGKI